MSAEMVPAAVVAGTGAAALVAIVVHERRRDARMRAGRVRLEVFFPADLQAAGPLAVLRTMSGLDYRQELVLELEARAGEIRHAVLLSPAARPIVEASLQASLPGVRITEASRTGGLATIALKVFIPTPIVLHGAGPEHASRTLLSLAARLRGTERVVLKWAISSTRPRAWQASSDDRDAAAKQRAWEQKTSAAGLSVSGLVLVYADSKARAREIGEQVVSAMRAREERHGALRTIIEQSGRSMSAVPQVSRSSGWLTIDELLSLLGWPVGVDYLPGLERGGARERLVPPQIPRTGRVIFIGRDLEGDRPVALSPEAARHHLAVVGPTGTGKSVLIGRAILDDIDSGAAGVVVDPKADLVDDVLNHLPARHAERIVVLDPADERLVPGVDIFGSGDPDLRVDVLVGALAAIYRDSFGIRSQIYLRLGFRTLADVPGATIADLSRLFFDAAFRRQALARLVDPVLRAQWQAYEALSPAAQAEHVASPMAKITELTARPAVRAVLAPAKATLDIPTLLASGRWLFISLSPGRLGEPASKLLGSILLYSVWSAIEGRAALPPEARSRISLFVDELSSVAALPVGLELLLERARGLNAGVVLALQSLARLPEPLRAVLLANSASLVTFRASADEATRLARELPGMTALDIGALSRFQVAARVGTGLGSEVAVMTGITRPWPERTGLAREIRDRSSARYGVPRSQPAEPLADEDEPQVGRTRRRS
jgi:hypothetical protein